MGGVFADKLLAEINAKEAEAQQSQRLSKELDTQAQYLGGIREKMQPIFAQTMDPERYQERLAMLEARQNAQIGNRMAGSGLGGSALDYGQRAESSRQLMSNMEQQRLNEAMGIGRYEQGLSGTITGIYGQREGIETQRAGIQAQLDAAQMEANATKESGIASAIGTIGGFALGGPLGAGIGKAAGGLFSSAGASVADSIPNTMNLNSGYGTPAPSFGLNYGMQPFQNHGYGDQ
jgi:hypothetical protein